MEPEEIGDFPLLCRTIGFVVCANLTFPLIWSGMAFGLPRAFDIMAEATDRLFCMAKEIERRVDRLERRRRERLSVEGSPLSR